MHLFVYDNDNDKHDHITPFSHIVLTPLLQKVVFKQFLAAVLNVPSKASSHHRVCLNPVDSGVMAMKHLSVAAETLCLPICFPHRVPQQSSFSSLMLCN